MSYNDQHRSVFAERANRFVLGGAVFQFELAVTHVAIEVGRTFEYFSQEAESKNSYFDNALTFSN